LERVGVRMYFTLLLRRGQREVAVLYSPFSLGEGPGMRMYWLLKSSQKGGFRRVAFPSSFLKWSSLWFDRLI